MVRHSFVSLLLLCFSAAQVHAARVPVVDNAAKKHHRTAAHASARWRKSVPAASAAQSGKRSESPVAVNRRTKRSGFIRSRKKPVLTRSLIRLQPIKVQEADSGSECLLHDFIGITSKSAVILDARSGETLFAKAADEPRQPASTIKVLTGLIAIKRLNSNEQVEISQHAEEMPRSKVYLKTDQEYKADDLINAVLLASANDASVALAEKIAGSEPAFARLMTMHASLWGATNTICRTASGLTAQGQQSTAHDLAQIFRHAMQNQEFAERMRQVRVRTSFGALLRNHNKALWQVEGAEAGKTGYTSIARQTYVGQFRRGNDAIVVAIMGSETMWRDIKRLVEYGFQKKEQVRVARFDRQDRTLEVQ